MRARAVIIALASALVLLGCSTDEANQTPVPVGFTSDADDGVAPANIFLRGRVESNQVVVDVIAMGIKDIHGIAFRLSWDPAKLTLVESRSSEAWSMQSISLAKEGVPGELAIAWTEKGSGAGVEAHDETRLGSMIFAVKTHDTAKVGFREGRSMLLDSKGNPVVAAWRGGSITAR